MIWALIFFLGYVTDMKMHPVLGAVVSDTVSNISTVVNDDAAYWLPLNEGMFIFCLIYVRFTFPF